MSTALTIRDLMTPDVVSVPPETAVVAVARLLAERGISAVPVLDKAGAVLGIVTEADLIRRLAGAEDAPSCWFRNLFADPAAQADRYARTHGATAGDVMTTAVVTVPEATTASHIAHLMEERGIRRVLVVEEGRLRGLVSRADLLRALVSPPAGIADLSDDRIRRAVLAAMRKQPWADTFYTLVEVKDGVVEFHGFMRTEAEAGAARTGRDHPRREERGGPDRAAAGLPLRLGLKRDRSLEPCFPADCACPGRLNRSGRGDCRADRCHPGRHRRSPAAPSSWRRTWSGWPAAPAGVMARPAGRRPWPRRCGRWRR